MKKQWLSETDMEVACFHPVCAEALEKALDILGLTSSYEVQHHRSVNGLEMDLVISNKTTNKILCVVEVKRTVSAVYSTRYQYQAMSYVQSLRDIEKEANYYILTNLECSCLFLYTQRKPSVYDQVIQPGYIFTHRFEDVDELTFRCDLAIHFKDLLQRIFNRDSNYLLSFSHFAEVIKGNMPSVYTWNSSLAYMFYEYIRGSFKGINRSTNLQDIRLFKNNLHAICSEASRINFKDIFGLSENDYDFTYKTTYEGLNDLYQLGYSYKDADLICNVMHQVISEGHTHEGEVPTDIELAQTLLSFVKVFIPHISEGQNITDPAAGSGTLLSAAIHAYPDISPSQIQANDINEKLLQLLSLRMGLSFASTISKNCSPNIYTSDICDLQKSFFEHTKVIVLNPPYLSAVAEGSSKKKSNLARRITELTGKKPKTNIGQAPLECLFIELVTCLVKAETVVACIIPSTHIVALGAQGVSFRKFLLEDFGLSMIFTYPYTNLFNEVVQNTSIIIGQIRKRQENIAFVHSNSYVSEITQDSIPKAISELQISESPKELTAGLGGCLVPYETFCTKVENGWSFLHPTVTSVSSNINELLMKNENVFREVSDAGYVRIYRGRVGNSGGNDLLYITAEEDLLKEIQNFLKPGLRNADFANLVVGDGDRYFFDVRNLEEARVKEIISLYLSSYTRSKKQPVRERSVDEWFEILKKESQYSVPPNSVLLPRGTRKVASVYITNKPTYVSTNFVCVETEHYEEARILSSWMSSIFYQLQLEIYSKNQKGMRKLEIANVLKTHVPKIDLLSVKDRELILNTEISEFCNLTSPNLREVDRVWARIILRDDNIDSFLDNALRDLTILVNTRES